MKPLVQIEEIEPCGNLEDKLILPSLEVREKHDLDDPKYNTYINASIMLCLRIYQSKEKELLNSNNGDIAIIIPAHQLECKKHLLIIGPSKPSLINYIKEIYPKTDPYMECIGRPTEIIGPR